MYYLDEIMDRTFDSWGMMLGANDNSFWASTEIEMKPAPETSTPEVETTTTTSTPAETPAWESADTSDWNESSDGSWEPTPINETVQQIADTAREFLEDINPFTDEEPDNR